MEISRVLTVPPISTSFRFLTQDEVCTIFGIDSSTLDNYIGKHLFPGPYILGDESIRWRSDEIEAIIQSFPYYAYYKKYGRDETVKDLLADAHCNSYYKEYGWS